MKIPVILAASALISLGTADSEAGATQTSARMTSVFENVLLLHVDGDVSIPMFFEPGGQVYYIDLHLKAAELNKNYTRLATWKLHGEELCVTKARDEIACLQLPQLEVGRAVETKVRGLNEKGETQWQILGQLMLMPGRPSPSALSAG